MIKTNIAEVLEKANEDSVIFFYTILLLIVIGISNTIFNDKISTLEAKIAQMETSCNKE